MSYVPLWCKTGYSFLQGASQPEELVQAAAEMGLTALAITDHDGKPVMRCVSPVFLFAASIIANDTVRSPVNAKPS